MDDMDFHSMGFETTGILGRGNFSTVYEVKRRLDSLCCACKVSKDISQLEREAELLQRNLSPLVPSFIHFKKRGAQAYLFMERIGGQSLSQRIKGQGILREKEAIEIGLQLTKGLLPFHRQATAIVIRDIKPEHIFSEEGRIRLLDLGSATWGTEWKNRAGTPGFASPEQLVYGESIGPYSDVYSVCSLIYYMVTGMAPEEGTNYFPMSRKLAFLLRAGLEKDTTRRLPNMEALSLGLLQCAHRFGKTPKWFVAFDYQEICGICPK